MRGVGWCCNFVRNLLYNLATWSEIVIILGHCVGFDYLRTAGHRLLFYEILIDNNLSFCFLCEQYANIGWLIDVLERTNIRKKTQFLFCLASRDVIHKCFPTMSHWGCATHSVYGFCLPSAPVHFERTCTPPRPHDRGVHCVPQARDRRRLSVCGAGGLVTVVRRRLQSPAT